MRGIIKLSAICNNCGCPDMEERHDHYWCDWCGNEIEVTETHIIIK